MRIQIYKNPFRRLSCPDNMIGKTLLCIALLTGSTLQQVQAAKQPMPWDNGRLKVSANQRFLQFENGKPFFWLGDTGWLLPQRLNREEAAFYLNRCRMAGFNVVQVQVMDGVPSINAYGQMSTPAGWKMEQADPEGVYSYWKHLDYIIKTAERNGIYIGMVAIWGSQVKAGLINEQQAEAYGRFLAKRYKDAPNIVWIMGGDIQGDIHPEVWNALATTIKSIDHNHLMTFHPRGRHTSAQWWSRATWIDFHTFQSGHRKYGQRMNDRTYPIPDNTEEDNWMYVDSTWTYKPVKPVIDDEPAYEDIPKGLHDPGEERWKDCDVRRYAYWSVFAGSCGHTYGHNAIMQMLKPGYHTGYGTDGKEPTWYEALDAPGFNQMKHLKKLMLSLPSYFDRVPDPSVIAGKNGKRYDRLIATRGNDFLLVYNYSGRSMQVDLRKIKGKRKKVWWMDAASGQRTFIGEYNDTIISYTPPTQPQAVRDGVLVAVNAEASDKESQAAIMPGK